MTALHFFVQLLITIWSICHTIIFVVGLAVLGIFIFLGIQATIHTYRTGETYSRWSQRRNVFDIKQSIMDQEPEARFVLKEWYLREIGDINIEMGGMGENGGEGGV